MTEPWATDRDFDLEIAKAAISSQFPDLLEGELSWIGSGWDYDVVQTGQWVVQFPRRRVSLSEIEQRCAVLELAAGELKICEIDVPVADRIGEPSAHFPYHFLVSPYIGGDTKK